MNVAKRLLAPAKVHPADHAPGIGLIMIRERPDTSFEGKSRNH